MVFLTKMMTILYKSLVSLHVNLDIFYKRLPFRPVFFTGQPAAICSSVPFQGGFGKQNVGHCVEQDLVGLNNPLGRVSPDPFSEGFHDNMIRHCVEQEAVVATNVDPERVSPDPLRDEFDDELVRHCLEQSLPTSFESNLFASEHCPEPLVERDTSIASVVDSLDDFIQISRFAIDNEVANDPIVRQKLIDIAWRRDFFEPQRHLDQLIAWSLSHGDISHFPIVPFTPLNHPQPMTTTTTGTKPMMVGTGENPPPPVREAKVPLRRVNNTASNLRRHAQPTATDRLLAFRRLEQLSILAPRPLLVKLLRRQRDVTKPCQRHRG